MRNEQIDFIGVDYDMGDRRARGEDSAARPGAEDRRDGVLPLRLGGRIFKRAGTTPLPEWAAEFDAKTWAQFFLKYVISHPAVTVARPGTTKPAHMLENIGGGIGRCRTRRRGSAWRVHGCTPRLRHRRRRAATGSALSAAILDRYVGEYKAASGFTAIFRRDGDKLMVKPGNNPEGALIARSRDAVPGSARARLRVPARRPGKGDRCLSGAADSQGSAEDAARRGSSAPANTACECLESPRAPARRWRSRHAASGAPIAWCPWQPLKHSSPLRSIAWTSLYGTRRARLWNSP